MPARPSFVLPRHARLEERFNICAKFIWRTIDFLNENVSVFLPLDMCVKPRTGFDSQLKEGAHSLPFSEVLADIVRVFLVAVILIVQKLLLVLGIVVAIQLILASLLFMGLVVGLGKVNAR